MESGNRLKVRHLILLPCLLLFSGYASGTIYKWTDAQGRVHFSDKKPGTPQARDLQLQNNPISVVGHDEIHSPKGQFSHALPKQKAIQRPQVVMYSTDWCTYCKQARAYFRQHGIRFVDYDIEKNAAAAQRYKQLNGRGVPLIFVGNTRMNGFSIQGFEQAYYSGN